jgi:hypothetical protein
MSPTESRREGDSRNGLFTESSLERRKQDLIETWNQLDLEEDFGAADRGVIMSLRVEVTEALDETPPDLDRADSLTATVFLLIQSNTEC